MRIFLTGLTSARLGAMEHHNLGNYTILEPLIDGLMQQYPNAAIYTSLQLSEQFCSRRNVTSVRHARLYASSHRVIFAALLDLVKVALWKAGRVFGYSARGIIDDSILLQQIDAADLVIDFSGDMYGDNSSATRFVDACIRLFAARILGKPTCMIAGSPGPFSRRWRLGIARRLLSRLELVTNREPESTELLARLGVNGSPMVTTACPSVLYSPSGPDNTAVENEGLQSLDRPIVGVVVSWWNLPHTKSGDYNLDSFVALVSYLADDLGLAVCLMSHQNATDEKQALVAGKDHQIISQLNQMAQNTVRRGMVLGVSRCYDAAGMRSLIGACDMVVSGRVHAAVQALSQHIPTVMIAYSDSSKAHKIRGFARTYAMEDYMARPDDAADLIDKSCRVWENRQQLRKMLELRVPAVVRDAKKNFELIDVAYRRHYTTAKSSGSSVRL